MIKLSNDIFTLILRTVWFILLALVIYFVFKEDYFLVLIFSFPVLGWTLQSKLFRVNSISFNRERIYIGKRKFDLIEIQEIESHILKNSYVKINDKKYFFMAPINDHGLENNLEKLKSYMTNRKNEILKSTAHNIG